MLTMGGVLHGPHPWACEIAHGEGIQPGTVLVAVSVVIVTDNGTERCSELSRSFHGTDLNALVDEALDYLRTLDEQVRDLHAHRCSAQGTTLAEGWRRCRSSVSNTGSNTATSANTKLHMRRWP